MASQHPQRGEWSFSLWDKIEELWTPTCEGGTKEQCDSSNVVTNIFIGSPLFLCPLLAILVFLI